MWRQTNWCHSVAAPTNIYWTRFVYTENCCGGGQFSVLPKIPLMRLGFNQVCRLLHDGNDVIHINFGWAFVVIVVGRRRCSRSFYFYFLSLSLSRSRSRCFCSLRGIQLSRWCENAKFISGKMAATTSTKEAPFSLQAQLQKWMRMANKFSLRNIFFFFSLFRSPSHLHSSNVRASLFRRFGSVENFSTTFHP